MRKLLVLLLILGTQLFAQNVVVVEDVAVTNLKDGQFYFPMVSTDGTNLLFSSDSYKGLWSKNLQTGVMTKITNENGAGYEPAFNSVTNELIYKSDKFIQGKRFSSLVSYNIASKRSVVLEDNVRDLKIVKSYNGNTNNYLKGNELRSISNVTMLKKTSSTDKQVLIENSKLSVYENNTKRELTPVGDGNYIWPSLSPDNSKILFTLAGRGSFVASLDGKILNRLGYANYPTWSNDGNWVLFMKDLDDGVKVISSDIYVANIITGKYYNLTIRNNNIPLNPRWGATNAEIFYNTDNGQIRKIKIKYE